MRPSLQEVAWEQQLTTELVSSANFCDLAELNKYPKCLSPLHFIWKLTGFTCLTQQDSTIAWTIWAWIYRSCTVIFGIMVFFPDYFVGSSYLMTWAEEKGMFRLSSRGVLGACEAAGLETLPDRRFGFFPPQIINRWPAASRLEVRIERVGVVEPLLPFLFVGARAPHRSFGSSG